MNEHWRDPERRAPTGREAPSRPEGPVREGAQRRQLTVMFCDLAGSTRMASRLDPEDLSDVLAAFLRCCAREVEAAGGYVARYMGDGLLAYFGYPVGREDDVARAAQAAIAIREAVPRLPVAHGRPLAVRIGIATGVVVVGEVVGDGPASERTVVGATPNLAARLQGCAGRNEVIVSDAARQLGEAEFRYEDLGVRRLKGFGATRIHRLQDRRSPEPRPGSRADVARLAGRSAERAWLLAHWAAAAAGRGRIVQLTGPAGIGKSRLVEELQAVAGQDGAPWLYGDCADLFRTSALHPVGMVLRRLLAPAGDEPADRRRRRLRLLLARSGVRDPHALELVAALAGLEDGPSRLSAQAQRERLFAALLEGLTGAAARRPSVLVLEDLHWSDPSTLQLLQSLAPLVRSARLLVVCTSREAAIPGLRVARGRRLSLTPLADADVERLVRAIAGDAEEGEVRAAVARADGVPLFAEELAHLIASTAPERGEPIPATLSDLLTARLDALGPARTLAEVAAVLGQEGGRCALLAACAGRSEAQTVRAVEQLASAGVLVWRDRSAGHYAFRHALVRDAAYHGLLKSERRQLHRRAALALSRVAAGLVAARPEVLAHHWSHAGESRRALSAWSDAARVAASRRAYREAEQLYEAAIAELAVALESDERAEFELHLWSGLATARQITRGYSAPATVAATRRARRLAQRGGDITQQFQNAAGAWMAASSAGDYGKARPLAERLLRLARAEGDELLMAAACMMSLTARYRTGDLLGAEEAFEQGEAGFRSEAFRRYPGGPAQAFGNGAVNAWILDRAQDARTRTHAGLEISLASGNPYEAAFVQYMAGMQWVLMGDLAAGADLAERALAAAQSGGFPQFVATSRIVLGRALAGLGRAGEGLGLITAGLDDMSGKTHSRAGLTMCLTWRAETLALAGDPASALAAHDVALSANPEEIFFRPEALRLRGELKAELGQREAAFEDLEAAHTLARHIGAALFEQRAAASLATRRGVRAALR